MTVTASTTAPLPGTYGVVRTTGWISWLIRVLTRSRYDHAVIVIDPEPGTGRARIAYLDEYDPSTVLLSDEPLTDEQRAKIVEHALALVGTPYGFIDIGALALMLTLHRAPAWLASRADHERAMICSQLVAACGCAAGVDWLCDQEYPAQVTPGMLGERIIRRAWAPAGSEPGGWPFDTGAIRAAANFQATMRKITTSQGPTHEQVETARAGILSVSGALTQLTPKVQAATNATQDLKAVLQDGKPDAASNE